MGETRDPEHYCAHCRKRHKGIVWYYRRTADGGREFLCGPKFRALPPQEKPPWQSLEPLNIPY
jgi:hypothetical protein